MARELFCSVDEVRRWVGATENTVSDALVADLIAAASQFILREIGLPSLISRAYTRIFSGRGTDRLSLPIWPVTSVSALTIGGVAVPASTWSGGSIDQPGYILEPWAGDDSPAMQGIRMLDRTFTPGLQNISVTFTAGFRRTAEAQTVPAATPFRVTTDLKWIADHGVEAAGEPMTAVTDAPSLGEYRLGAKPGEYEFAEADADLPVELTYSYCPGDLWQACVEIVGDWYRKKDRIGHASKQLAGNETVSFTLGSIPIAAQRIIANNRRDPRIA